VPENRSYQTETIVIGKVKLGEADRILILFSRDYGKIEAVGKGVRRPRSKMGGHLELLTHNQVSLVQGRNLETIVGVQTIDGFLNLKNDIWLTSYGLYAAELVNQFTVVHAENQPIFRLLVSTLQELERGTNPELVMRYFELSLLESAGFRPQLQQCVACKKSLQPVENVFCVNEGGILCPECKYTHPVVAPISVDALKVLRLMQKSDISLVNRLKIEADLAEELKGILAAYIRYILERDVKALEWLDSLRNQMRQLAPR
jgi:DNA repair protein RecO (recombination protein O)